MEKFQEMNIRKNWKDWNILTSMTREVVSCSWWGVYQDNRVMYSSTDNEIGDEYETF